MGVLFYLLVVSLMLLLRSLFIFRVYLVVNIFGSILFGTLCASWSWMSVSFPRLSSVQFSSVSQLCSTLCDPMNRSTPGLPVHHQLPEFTQTHIHWVGDDFQPSYALSSPSPPTPNPSQHQSLFQWVNSLHEVAKVLEFQLLSIVAS